MIEIETAVDSAARAYGHDAKVRAADRKALSGFYDCSAAQAEKLHLNRVLLPIKISATSSGVVYECTLELKRRADSPSTSLHATKHELQSVTLGFDQTRSVRLHSGVYDDTDEAYRFVYHVTSSGKRATGGGGASSVTAATVVTPKRKVVAAPKPTIKKSIGARSDVKRVRRAKVIATPPQPPAVVVESTELFSYDDDDDDDQEESIARDFDDEYVEAHGAGSSAASVEVGGGGGGGGRLKSWLTSPFKWLFTASKPLSSTDTPTSGVLTPEEQKMVEALRYQPSLFAEVESGV